MASAGGTLYTGMTNNLATRVWQHKNGIMEGFTKRYKCHRLVYFEEFKDVRAAIARETEIKSWSRKKKISLIGSMNPRWEDLAASWGKDMALPQETLKEAEARLSKIVVLRVHRQDG